MRPAAEQGTLVFEDDSLTVRCTPLTHRVPAYAYRVEQKPLAGRFDIERARALEIPPGPIYARLKRGETVTLEDGGGSTAPALWYGSPGVSVVYCTDTVSARSPELARGADLLIHESTFAHAEAEMAFQQHLFSTWPPRLLRRSANWSDPRPMRMAIQSHRRTCWRKQVILPETLGQGFHEPGRKPAATVRIPPQSDFVQGLVRCIRQSRHPMALFLLSGRSLRDC